jgi:aspartyl/asparaginyl beta-hydroxylase (cupin superfamily)
MKNKIFELYKPDSLEAFLKFHKENPMERFVYVIQQPAPNINILSASDFGYLVICLPNRDQAIYSTAPYVQKMTKNLQNIRKEDYLLAVGDPVIIMLSGIIANDNTNGQFNVLKWDKREYRYYPLDFDMYQKGEKNDG